MKLSEQLTFEPRNQFKGSQNFDRFDGGNVGCREYDGARAGQDCMLHACMDGAGGYGGNDMHQKANADIGSFVL